MDVKAKNNMIAEGIEAAILAYGRHIEEVLIRGQVRQPLEFFADYAQMLRDNELHDCMSNTMVNGSCAVCGKLMKQLRRSERWSE